MLRRNVELLAGAGRPGVRDPLARRRRPQRALEPDQGRRLRAARGHPARARTRRSAATRCWPASRRGVPRPRRGRPGDGRRSASATSPTRRPRPAYDDGVRPLPGPLRGAATAVRGVERGGHRDRSTHRLAWTRQDSSGRLEVTVKAKIGVLVMALLEDDYNKTGHMRPAATAAAQEIADLLSAYGDVVHAGLVEEEHQAAAAARMFNAEDVDIIVAMELAYTKGVVPARCFIDTTAPVLVWNAQRISRLGEDDGFDVVMLNSGMAGMPELTAVLLRTGRDFTMVTSRLDDPEGRRKVAETIAAAAVRRRLRDGPGRPRRTPLRGHDRPHVRRPLAPPGHRAGRLAARAREGRRPLRRDRPGRRRRDRRRRSGRSTPSRWSPPSSSGRSGWPWPSNRWSRSTASTRSPRSTRSG